MKRNKIEQKIELYFHIPFCIKKCLYCDFLSAPSDEQTMESYMAVLLRETEKKASFYKDYEVDTIFIGGGTPSLVSGMWIERLLRIVRKNFQLSEEVEISIEVNPGTVSVEKLRCYQKAGINRLSIGLQSARDEELRRIGRIHTWEKFKDTYHLAVEMGFQNINIDVISALPGQSFENYMETLQNVLHLNPKPNHISAYSLIVEEGTAFYRMYEKGELQLPDEDTERRMYQCTEEVLSNAGYSRYEISNYALPGYRCRHNVGYWRRTNYVGFGIGAASLVNHVRFRNNGSLKKYLENPLCCRCEDEILSREDEMEEFMFLGLRMTEGVSVKEFERYFHCNIQEVYADILKKNQEDGLLEIVNDALNLDSYIRLTKRGLDLSNYVMQQFLLG